MLSVKIFSNDSAGDLEYDVKQWLGVMGDKIEITRILQSESVCKEKKRITLTIFFDQKSYTK